MSYSIKTYDGKTYALDDSNAKDLKEAWIGSKQSFPVELGNDVVQSSSIKSIEKNTITEADIDRVFETSQSLPSGKICRGQKSIQTAINNVAKLHEDWSEKIQNKSWREKTRQKLLAKDKAWCDYKTNSCVCR